MSTRPYIGDVAKGESARADVDLFSPESTADVERVYVAIIQLARNLRAAVPSSLSRASTTALAAVVKYGPLSVSELAAREGVAGASMSRTLAQLLALGLVARTQNGADGRVAHVTATTAGHELFLAHRAANAAFLQERMALLHRADIELVTAVATALERLVAVTGSEVPTRDAEHAVPDAP